MDSVAELSVLMTGTLDGEVGIWDMKTGALISAKKNLHPGGAINGICHSWSQQSIITAGADKKIKVLFR